MSDMSYTERAKRGARLLDDLKPDWFEGVHLDTLRMDSLTDCILGQVFGDWMEGSHLVGLAYDRPGNEWYGFELTVDEYTDSISHTLAGLHDAWAAEILERMA